MRPAIELHVARRLCCPMDTARLCAGDRCLAWQSFPAEDPVQRVYLAEGDDATATVEPQRPPQVPDTWEWSPHDPAAGEPAAWIQPESEIAAPLPRGYCRMVPA